MEPKFSLDKISYNVIKKLDSLKMTLGTVESCTGGLVSQYITKHPGSSKVFINGYITYSNTSKINLLNIDKKVLDKYGAVSKQVVLQMVKNLLIITKVDVGIAVSGIAGPSGGSKNKPVGLVHHAISIKGKTFHQKIIFDGNRSDIRIKAAKKCFELILENI